MTRTTTFLAGMLAAGAAFAAGPTTHFLRIPASALTYGSATAPAVRGRVVEIQLDSPAAGVTGTVSVTAASRISTRSALTLATGTISNDFTVYPAIDMTDNAGAALTGDTPEHPLLYGEVVTFAVTNGSATNVEWLCIIKTEE